MTVQSIDKRLVAEANMTSVTTDKTQPTVSVEDAFVSLLAQTNQRYGAKTADASTPGKVLAQHFNRKAAETKADKAQPTRDEAPAERAPAAKETRAAAKADKARPAQAAAPAAKPAPKDDAPTASAPVSDEDGKTVAAADDNAPRSDADQGDAQTAGQGNAKAEAQQVEASAVAVQQQVVVEIDITVEETVEVVALDASAPVAADADADAGDDGLDLDAVTKGPLAGLSKDDRKRVHDLEKRIVADLDSGDVNDALDAATELVSQLIDKAGQQKTADAQVVQQDRDLFDTMREQINDLSQRLAGTDSHLDIKVQVNQTATDAGAEVSAVDSTLFQVAAETEQMAGDAARHGPQQQGPRLADTAATAQLATQANTAVEQTVDDLRTFSAVLAAQVEAAAQDTKAAPEQRSVTGLAAIGQTQAAEKSSSAQAAQAPRAPRVPLQQQVMEQVSVQIDKAVKDGADTVKIQLKPLELGRIEIKLEVVDGRVSATVTADKPETLALLQKDSKGLEKALEDAGLSPEANATSFSLRNGEQQNTADRGQQGRRGRGHAQGGSDADLPVIDSAQAAQPRRSGGRVGVDISV
ncbi:hypothetical protein A6A04_05380 [Paramagnetospirillum marisnigri]|uniref:Flagellar hook-length control protein-like C-terminal domain-containing protein n=1 Tax=Paramagnetospirillum marisnigri TaxID=1285242 RepID=A0A178MHJ5_9PROT|nr:flagellar hook-length control protein FliK [Paramagnetospirillum marisnigri]OAN48182.1 hypothetical protein A6A04_05380 [Paramagnetospirillum marisnigri]